MRIANWVLLGALLPLSVASAADRPAQVMVVGTFHFSNPGHDQHNVKADDVLLPERQKQLEAIGEALARYRPTRVAVEWPKELVDERYAKFLDGTLEPSRNEVVQLGFRVAKRAGLARVDGIDVDGDFPYEPVAAWAAKHGEEPRLRQAHAKVEAMVKRIGDLQQTAGIGAVLREMNRPEAIADDATFYGELMHYGAGAEQPGAELAAAWAKRNYLICARLVQAIEPGDRVIVFYGSGHSHLLRLCVRDVPGLELVEPNDYLPQ